MWRRACTCEISQRSGKNICRYESGESRRGLSLTTLPYIIHHVLYGISGKNNFSSKTLLLSLQTIVCAWKMCEILRKHQFYCVLCYLMPFERDKATFRLALSRSKGYKSCLITKHGQISNCHGVHSLRGCVWNEKYYEKKRKIISYFFRIWPRPWDEFLRWIFFSPKLVIFIHRSIGPISEMYKTSKKTAILLRFVW